MLDTWFSSALWPFSTLGWPDQDAGARRRSIRPNVLVTSFDIIFFWVARMIMMGLKFMGDVPFREVYIHALVRDHEGQKMSKSKGNILDPLDLIDGVDLETLLQEAHRRPHAAAPAGRASSETTRKEFPDGIAAFGTDALRFTFASLATTGRDARFDSRAPTATTASATSCGTPRRIVLSQLDGVDDGRASSSASPTAGSARGSRATIARSTTSFAIYRLDLVAQTLYDFAWHEFCDWYLELTKAVLTDPTADPALRRGAQHTLVDVLGRLLKLLHPLMPFVTEELWLELCRRDRRRRARR